MPEESIIKEEDRFHEAEGESFDSAVCPGCGCLCEDIDLTLKEDQVVQIFHACSWGLSKFHLGHRFLREPKHAKIIFPSRKEPSGRSLPISFEEGYEKAAATIQQAKRVVLFGLCQTTFKAQEKAAALVKRLNAQLFPSEGMLLTPFFKSIKSQRYSMATLEEIRQLATTIVFWGTNPLHSCPRLAARYTVFVAGINAPDRHISRKVFYADPYENDMGAFAQRIPVEPENELERLNTLIEIIEEGSYSIPKELEGLVQAIEASPFVAVFAGRGIAYSKTPQALMDALVRLSNTISKRTACALLPVISDFNAMGLYLALSHEGINPADSPLIKGDLQSYQPERGDTLVCIGSDPFWFFKEDQIAAIHTLDLPVIAISSFQNQTTHAASLVIPVALTGVEAEGLAFRMDGIPVWLRKVLPTAQPTDLSVLTSIEERLFGDHHG